MTPLLTITIALLITFIGARIASHFKYPPILGQFIASIFLSTPFIKEAIFTQEATAGIDILAELAIIFLLLLTGLESDTKKINQCKKESILIAIFASIAPFILGFLIGNILGFNTISSVVLGISLSITAEGTNVAILIQLKKVKSKIGSILIGAGMIDDILGMIYLSIILILANKSNVITLFLFPAKLAIFVILIWLSSKIIPYILEEFEKKGKEVAMFNMVILIALTLSIFSELSGLSAIVGAFIAGIILQKSFILKKDEKHEEHEIEIFLFGFIIPFFFIQVGLNFDLLSVIDNLGMTLIILIVALSGKIIGALMARPFSKRLNCKQIYLIGWAMNSRGVIELIVANIALKANLISTQLYSIIVFVAILATIISPFFVRNMIKKHPQIMD